jgi:rhomboid protease GluP
VCRECGALVGAGESDCMVCGAPSTAGREAGAGRRPPRQDRETMRFLSAIVSRPATFTFAFLVANVFLYTLMELSGGAQGEVLVAYGAKLNHLIDAGQWWRFVTPIFLHVHISTFGPLPLHLIFNMYGLFMLGPYVEKLYGSAKFVVFWVSTGVAGVFVSYLTYQPELAHGVLGSYLFKVSDAPAAGASVSLFGLVGVLFVFGIRFRGELPAGFRRAFGTGMLPMILFNLLIGYMARDFIDNSAHLGGFAAGSLLALFVEYKRPGERGPVAYAWHVLQAASLALVVACFTLAALAH